MNDKSLLRTGIYGTTTMAICCFTPFLVVLLGFVGLSAWLSWLDYVLLPGLAISLAILGYALVLRAKRRNLGTEAGDG